MYRGCPKRLMTCRRLSQSRSSEKVRPCGAEVTDSSADSEWSPVIDEEVNAEGSEDLEATKEADEREDSETTELMDIDEPEPVRDVPATRASTVGLEEDEAEEDELTEEIDVVAEPPNEPGVTPREISFPLGNDDEELEW